MAASMQGGQRRGWPAFAGEISWHPPQGDAGSPSVPGAGDQLQPEVWASLQSCSSPERLRGPHQLQASMQEPSRPPSSLAMPAWRQPSLLQPIVWVQPSWFEAAQAGGTLCSLLRARSTAWGGFPSTIPLSPSQSIPPSTGWGMVLVPPGIPSPAPPAAPAVGASAGEQGWRVGCSCWRQRCCGGAGSW